MPQSVHGRHRTRSASWAEWRSSSAGESGHSAMEVACWAWSSSERGVVTEGAECFESAERGEMERRWKRLTEASSWSRTA